MTAAGRIHRLRGLGSDAFHDWGGAHIGLHAFVLIDRSAGRITLLVAADD
ncbi:hypothetical protein [Actinacidiphila yeochonensis]|nr:hypothetical protein [Actinacidiphila yeochonensis]